MNCYKKSILLFLLLAITTLIYNHQNLKYLSEIVPIRRSDFYVIAVVFNPAGYQSRYASYQLFENHMKNFDVELITVELAITNQPFKVTNAWNSNHIQLKTDDILWYKENLINIAVQRLPNSCKYVAWIDLEVEFLNKNWVNDAKRELEKFKVVQLFDLIKVLDPKGKTIEASFGVAKCYTRSRNNTESILYFRNNTEYRNLSIAPALCSTGYAWATTRNLFLKIGGLFDKGIVGDGDGIVALSYFGRVFKKYVMYKSEYFRKEIAEYQNRCLEHVNSSVGPVPGMINHLWHGSKGNRGYMGRRNILNSDKLPYNPKEHLYYDDNGILRFKQQYRKYYIDFIKQYFLSRKEDKNT